jgi:hypothetical protein
MRMPRPERLAAWHRLIIACAVGALAYSSQVVLQTRAGKTSLPLAANTW